MTQEILRERLVSIIQNEGVTQKYITKKIDIAESLLSRFKNNQCELDYLDSEALDKFLQSKGY